MSPSTTPSEGRVEIYIRSLADQEAAIAGRRFAFAAGEIDPYRIFVQIRGAGIPRARRARGLPPGRHLDRPGRVVQRPLFPAPLLRSAGAPSHRLQQRPVNGCLLTPSRRRRPGGRRRRRRMLRRRSGTARRWRSPRAGRCGPSGSGGRAPEPMPPCPGSGLARGRCWSGRATKTRSIGVSIGPGQIALTRILSGARRLASERTKPTTPNLAIE